MSLYESLTVLSNKAFPATDVIKSLLCILSNDLCASNLQRNSHTFCTLISRSRDICDHINSLIEKSITEDGWTSYDQYTAMIEPLEALLLSVSEVTDTPRVETLTDAVNIDQWITGAQSWNIDRKKVKDSLTTAFSKDVFQSIAPTLTSEDITYSWKHDDDVFMDNLIRGLEHRFKSAAGVQSRFVAIQSKLKEIQMKAKDSISDEIIVIAIKSTILVNDMVQVIINTNVPEIRAHLGSVTVLSETQELLDSISQNFGRPRKADLEKKYSDFEALLKMKQGVDPTRLPPGSRRAPGSFLELQKFPGNIRPPYYLQTLVLVQYCHTLVDHYLKAESELPRKPMDDAISATTIALHGAANLRDKVSNRTTIDFENVQSSEVTDAYKSAIATVRSSHRSYEIEFDASRMDTAKENDAKRLKAWKDRVQGKNMNKPLGHVEIVVKFKDEALPRSTVNPREQKISVPPTTQLDVILWEVLAHASPEVRDRIRSRSHFKTEYPSETLSLSDPASKVAGRVLLLVIAA
ncbi:hypothetical protein EV421DRAFT_1772512 [Armillaria borealis]|uniref:Uncharacterized protein n=1 Tax=Armillaria borealis TaxID=47425 RepID=A0AA39K3T3_9AGAR|nr:hypothetical protein EV421DRAFT_1772512 [Armillaria borealis]